MARQALTDRYVSITEASIQYGYAPVGTALRIAARLGKIKAEKIGGRYLLDRASVKEYAEQERKRWGNLPKEARVSAATSA